jgi:hypothetical protein
LLLPLIPGEKAFNIVLVHGFYIVPFKPAFKQKNTVQLWLHGPSSSSVKKEKEKRKISVGCTVGPPAS